MTKLMMELKRVKADRDPNFDAAPEPDNILKWLFVFNGPADTDFEGGRYVGQILFKHDYPLTPPSIMILTPNGRYEPSTSICLSNSSYHPESWNPLWGVRTVALGIISMMNTKDGGVGSLNEPQAKRKLLAQSSRKFNVTQLRDIYEKCLPDAFKADLAVA